MIARESRITCSEGHIEERIGKLRHIESVALIHGDMYELTTDGKLYLEGQIDAQYRP